MRSVFVALAVTIGMGLAAPASSGATAEQATLLAQTGQADPQANPQPPARDDDVGVDVNPTNADAAWYRDPMWIVVGALAIVVLLVLIVAATRGGGPTIIRD
jgi:hypothetical protein